jgi:anti-anti-sigma factor
MLATGYPFQMAGGVPVVTAHAEIDATTVSELRAILSEWHSRGDVTVVVDMTGTEFCELAGLRELARAHDQAVADGGGLLLVMPGDGALMAAFTIAGLDGLIPHFATLENALAGIPATAIRPSRLRRAPASQGAPGPVREQQPALVADSRGCEQCGAMFVPQREYARFCSGDCRAAWNREQLGDPAVEASALTWSIAAMSEATARLPSVKVWDQPHAFAAIEEAVWWMTMVDATLVRHHSAAYDAVLAQRSPAERQLLEEVMAGLLFVRDWIGRGAGLAEALHTDPGCGRITRWTWKPIRQPVPAGVPTRTLAWEQARHRAYQARLAGHTIAETFGQAVTFLALAGTGAVSATDIRERATGS